MKRYTKHQKKALPSRQFLAKQLRRSRALAEQSARRTCNAEMESAEIRTDLARQKAKTWSAEDRIRTLESKVALLAPQPSSCFEYRKAPSQYTRESFNAELWTISGIASVGISIKIDGFRTTPRISKDEYAKTLAEQFAEKAYEHCLKSIQIIRG